jgi:hypothetical protein
MCNFETPLLVGVQEELDAMRRKMREQMAETRAQFSSNS